MISYSGCLVALLLIHLVQSIKVLFQFLLCLARQGKLCQKLRCGFQISYKVLEESTPQLDGRGIMIIRSGSSIAQKYPATKGWWVANVANSHVDVEV